MTVSRVGGGAAASQGNETHFQNLPSEMIDKIFSSLSLKDLQQAMATCRSFYLVGKRVQKPWQGLFYKLWYGPITKDIKFTEDKAYRYCQVIKQQIRAGNNVWKVKHLEQNSLFEVVTVFVLSPDQKIVVAGYGNGSILAWNLKSGKQLPNRLAGHGGSICRLAFTNQGMVISSSFDNTMKISDLYRERTVATIPNFNVHSCKFVATEEGKIISSFSNGRISVLDLKVDVGSKGRKTILSPWGNVITHLELSPNQRIVVVGYKNDNLRAWDLGSKQLLAIFEERASITCLAISQKKIISGHHSSEVKVWDIATCLLSATLNRPADRATREQIEHGPTVVTGNRPTCVAISQEEEKVIIGSENGTVSVWGIENAEELYSLCQYSYTVSHLHVMPNGGVISKSYGEPLTVWDVERGRALFSFPQRTSQAQKVIVTKEGTIVITDEGGMRPNILETNSERISELVKAPRVERPSRSEQVTFTKEETIVIKDQGGLQPKTVKTNPERICPSAEAPRVERPSRYCECTLL